MLAEIHVKYRGGLGSGADTFVRFGVYDDGPPASCKTRLQRATLPATRKFETQIR